MSAPVSSIPKFVDQYYKTSTFHHLSTWKAKQLKLAQSSSQEQSHGSGQCEESYNSQESQPGSQETGDTFGILTPTASSTCFAYFDMDCFYVSVERRDNPCLDGKKVIVCPTQNLSPSSIRKSTSEISSASYEARKCGVKSRMFLKDAFALCPDAVFLPCNYRRYEATSDLFYKVLRRYAKTLQPISADEAVMDLAFACSDDSSSLSDFVQKIRNEIFDTTGCPCSAGVGPNLLLAKLAVSKAKPEGQKIVEISEVASFLEQIPVDKLPRVGEVLSSKLHAKDIRVISDLLSFSQETLKAEFGPTMGQNLYNFARGKDTRCIQTSFKRKSIGTQISWGIRFGSDLEVQNFIVDLAKEISLRLRGETLKGKKITLNIKVKAGKDSEATKYMNPGRVNIVSKSSRLPSYSDDAVFLAKRAFQLFKELNVDWKDVRGVALQMSELDNQNDSQVSKRHSPLGKPSSSIPSGQSKLTSFFCKK